MCDRVSTIQKWYGGENHIDTGYNYFERMHFPTFHGLAVTCETLYRIAEFPVS